MTDMRDYWPPLPSVEVPITEGAVCPDCQQLFTYCMEGSRGYWFAFCEACRSQWIYMNARWQEFAKPAPPVLTIDERVAHLKEHGSYHAVTITFCNSMTYLSVVPVDCDEQTQVFYGDTIEEALVAAETALLRKERP